MKLHNEEHIIYSCHQRVLWFSQEGLVACVTLLWETSSACYLTESTAVLNHSMVLLHFLLHLCSRFKPGQKFTFFY